MTTWDYEQEMESSRNSVKGFVIGTVLSIGLWALIIWGVWSLAEVVL